MQTKASVFFFASLLEKLWVRKGKKRLGILLRGQGFTGTLGSKIEVNLASC